MSESIKSVHRPHSVCLESLGWPDGRGQDGARAMELADPVLQALCRASTEPHHNKALRARMAEQVNGAWLSVPRDPDIPPRIRSRIPVNSHKLSIHEAEIVVDALERLADKDDTLLQRELLDLRLTIARLGGAFSALWIGRRVVEELRNRRSDATD